MTSFQLNDEALQLDIAHHQCAQCHADFFDAHALAAHLNACPSKQKTKLTMNTALQSQTTRKIRTRTTRLTSSCPYSTEGPTHSEHFAKQNNVESKAQSTLLDDLQAALPDHDVAGRVACCVCGRKFSPLRITKHETICRRVQARAQKRKMARR
eukprot:m.103221 g.103221  ORF g.103221 m.103221 type:complete len:154 (+) comp22390_c0_seq2:160-621(+)